MFAKYIVDKIEWSDILEVRTEIFCKASSSKGVPSHLAGVIAKSEKILSIGNKFPRFATKSARSPKVLSAAIHIPIKI
jgi:hypothetical protein